MEFYKQILIYLCQKLFFFRNLITIIDFIIPNYDIATQFFERMQYFETIYSYYQNHIHHYLLLLDSQQYKMNYNCSLTIFFHVLHRLSHTTPRSPHRRLRWRTRPAWTTRTARTAAVAAKCTAGAGRTAAVAGH